MFLDTCLGLYKTSIAIAVVPLFMYFVILGFNSPPSFPLDDSREVVDCQFVDGFGLSGADGRLNASIRVGNFIEFARSTALHMVHLLVEGDLVSSDFRINQFWDIVHNKHNISFCVLHPVLEGVTAKLMCHNRVLATMRYRSKSLDVYPNGWSRTYISGDLVARFADVCFSNDTLHYFAQPKTEIRNLALCDDHVIRTAIHYTPAMTYRDEARLPIHSGPVAFVSAAPTELWRQLTDVMLPLWAAVAASGFNNDWEVMLLRNQVHLIGNLEKIVNMKVIMKETAGCFGNAFFPRAPNQVTVSEDGVEIGALANHLTWMFDAKGAVLKLFRDRITSNQMIHKRVVIDSSLYDEVKSLFPGMDVVVLPESNDISEVADCVAEANVYIAGHVSTIVFAMFMSQGATLLEVQPTGLECTSYGRHFAESAGARYEMVPSPNKLCARCGKNDISCYLSSEIKWGRIPEFVLTETVGRATDKNNFV